MKRIIFICILLSVGMLGYSQDFHISEGISLEEISETEYRSAFKGKKKDKYKWTSSGKDFNRTVTCFLASDLAENASCTANANYWSYRRIKDVEIRCLKLNSNSRILQETSRSFSKSYYMNGTTLDMTTMFSIGNVDNNRVYFACRDLEWTRNVWCRWYSFAGGKVTILAELEDRSFDYDFGYDDLPYIFADNKGHYYLAALTNPNTYPYPECHVTKFYRITLRKLKDKH